MRHIVPVFLSCLVGVIEPAMAGRPVSQALGLSDIVARSSTIILVDRLSNAIRETRNEASGCVEFRWRLHVVKVLTTPANGVKKGDDIEIITNPTSLRDCIIRKNLPNGASFSAPRYSGSGSLWTQGGYPQRFIVFLTKKDEGYVLSAEHAFESEQRHAEVDGLLRPK